MLSFLLFVCLGVDFASSIEFTRRDVGKTSEISWGYNATHVEVQMTYRTQGWVALGLSPNGGMDQSDVLFGYINSTTNEPVVQDRFLTANAETHVITFPLDDQQDWQAISGSRNATHTVIRAVRKQRTCDPKDRPFLDASGFVLFAMSNKLPENPDAKIHRHEIRGKTTLNFLRPEDPPAPDITQEVSKILEFRVDNRTIKGDADYHYFCKMTTLPKFDRKYQSIASQPIINATNMKQIHHILLYMCNPLPAEDDYSKQDFFDCGPSSAAGGTFLMKYCQTVIAVWAMGAPPTSFQPEDVGLPFTTDMSGLKVAMQVHYNNPDRLTFVDDSGMRFLLTDKVRKHDSGSIMTGIFSLDYTLTMPPGLRNFHLSAQCSDQCTASNIPPDGITVFSSFVHMHTRGRSGVARQFRGTEEILPPLGAELNYDFNFQQTRPLLPYRKVLPGDRIIVECNFTTQQETGPIYGGEGTTEEMCLVFLYYYPKIDLNTCGSRFKIKPYLKAIGLDSKELMKQGKFPQMRSDVADQMISMEISKARRALIQNFASPINSFLTKTPWTAKSVNSLLEYYSQFDYLGICNVKNKNPEKTLIMNDKPPKIAPYADPAQTC
ncbi:DBH-like monooxygenase protein 1-like protein [Hypsibius exemplaris]|uniref:DBH-like monooxygenase protein 1-like protein n=1 Tax=Hypsibius exemplaris TaxID=2072580 RepID=A0A1W0X5M6_HYPEX|nr:DBH-like monooxygenase protein 1-like protein [Hypsibius exemplaris]